MRSAHSITDHSACTPPAAANVDEKGISVMDLISPKAEQAVHPFFACTACTSIVKDVKGFASDPSKIKTIKDKLSVLCRACPSATGERKCFELLDADLQKFVDYMRHTDPLEVCHRMHLCPSDEDALPRLLEDLLGSRMLMQQY